MAHGGDLFALGDGVSSEPNFEIAFRGYDKTQVDKYLRVLEAENATLATERDEAYGQLQALAAQVQQLQVELVEARKRTSSSTTVVTTNVSFRHLGPRVEQLPAMAEDPPESTKSAAVDSIAAARARAQPLPGDPQPH